MASSYVVLDTNVLPSPIIIGGPFWQAILRLCKLANVTVVLPEIVVHEAVNRYQCDVESAVEKLRSAVRDMAKQVDMLPVYIPSAEGLAIAWEADLRSTFTVVKIDGDDAVEALRREALRVRPARGGKGARDSAIWLTAMRLCAPGSSVGIVSRNTADFGEKDGTLHSSLRHEIAESGAELSYFNGLDGFVASIAEQVTFENLIVDTTSGIFLEALLEVIPSNLAPPVDQLGDETAEFKEMEILRSYKVDQSGLALVSGVSTITDDLGVMLFSALTTAWITFDSESREVLAIEVASIDPVVDSV